jgi:hypothetical protein
MPKGNPFHIGCGTTTLQKAGNDQVETSTKEELLGISNQSWMVRTTARNNSEG